MLENEGIEDVKEPEDIRSEPYTFEELGIRQMNRISVLAQKALGEKGIDQKYALLLLEGALVAFAAILPTVKSKNSVKNFKVRLRKSMLEESEHRIPYFNILMEWFELLVSEFYMVGNVVSGKDIDVYFTGTDEPKKKKEVKE